MDNAVEFVTVETEPDVEVQEVETTDSDVSGQPEESESIDLRLQREAVNLHLLTSTALLQDILSGSNEATRDHGHICPHCGKIYKTATTLNTHCLLKHPPNEQRKQCAICLKVYASAMSLQKHMQYKHTFKYRCVACYKGFETVEMLEHHKKTCGKSETLCPECGKLCASQIALRNHIGYKHPESTENWCFVCRRSFKSMRGLANHKATVHPAGATDCVFCRRSFNSTGALQSHLLYKHKAYGARCKECNKMFSNQASLVRHTLKNHPFTGKMYVCGVCLAGFKEAKQLEEHIELVHSGLAEQ